MLTEETIIFFRERRTSQVEAAILQFLGYFEQPLKSLIYRSQF